ncbi:MAG: hypothetical protein SNF68_06000 [Rikenellaceae bacterium]
MTNILISPQRVLELAYANAEYTPVSMITNADILTAERRYLIPVIGEQLYIALADGEYPVLMDEFVAPALAQYVREVANLPSAPRTREGMCRARMLMLRLSDELDKNSVTYSEYVASENILKRCRINGTHIQVR